MTSYILENSNFEKDIIYEWNIESLHVLSEPLNNFSNFVRKIKWNLVAKLEISGETYSEYGYGETVFDVSDLNFSELISFENLTFDTVVSWIKSQSDIENQLKTQLLDRKIYVTNIMELPWKTPETPEVIESNVEIISTNFPEETPQELTALIPTEEPAASAGETP